VTSVNFIFEFGFDAKEGKSQDLQRWLSGNEEKLAAEAPEGCEYLGTYVAVMSSEREAGNWRSMWRLARYGAQDDLSEAMKQGGTFARLMEEFTSFMDQRNDAHQSQTLLRRATNAAIWGE
jgi:hypothetical protein